MQAVINIGIENVNPRVLVLVPATSGTQIKSDKEKCGKRIKF